MAEWKECFKKEAICRSLESLRRQVFRYKQYATIWDVLMGVGIAVFFAFFFYRSVWAVLPMLAVGGVFVYWRLKRKKKNSDSQFLLQFQECVLSVAGALKAGYAVENAFAESIPDMEIMFGRDSTIVAELKKLCRGLQNNETLEVLLQNMALRSGLEEIREFAQVFVIAKRNSGKLPDTIEIYSKTITDRLELEAEIETLLAAKRLEQKVMNIMPFFIVLYLEYSNPGYFDMLYHNVTGAAIMSICLAVYISAYGLSEHIFQKTFG